MPLPVVTDDTIRSMASEGIHKAPKWLIEPWLDNLEEENPALYKMMKTISVTLESAEFIIGFAMCYGILSKQSSVDEWNHNYDIS